MPASSTTMAAFDQAGTAAGGHWDPSFTGAPGVDGWVPAIAVMEGDVYAGGEFNSAGGATVPVHSIARWNGREWLDVGGGIGNTHSSSISGNGRINSGSVYDLVSDGERLFVGGDFDRAGEVEAERIAMWDGSEWHALGAGVSIPNFNAWITGIAVHDDTVYVGGRFLEAGGQPANYIARWVDSTWSAMGDGFDHYVEDIAVDGNRVVAVGYRSDEEYASGKFVAEWNGNDWVSLADSVGWNESHTWGGRVDAVAIVNGDVYVGGLFTEINGVAANSIARWDGQAWHALGEGVDSNVWRLEPRGDGIVASGLFRQAGGKTAARIAYWDGSSWSPLGSGVSEVGCTFGGRVDGLAVDGDVVYASGCFSRAGDAFARNVASWDGAQWHAFGEGSGQGLSHSTNIVSIGDDGVYVGGRFSLAGPIVANGIARWDGTQWHALGDGVGDSDFSEVRTIFPDGPDIYVGGYFGKAGDVDVRNLARWDGEHWYPVGIPADSNAWRPSSVDAIAMYQGNLHAGGRFWNSAGGHTSALMRWENDEWQPLAGGYQLDWSVTTLVVHDSLLYVGGSFEDAGALGTSNIATWDGTAWKDIGGGLFYSEYPGAGTVTSISFRDTLLYAAGYFDRAQGRKVNNLAVWNGETWTGIPNGSGSIDGMTVDRAYLYIVSWGGVLDDEYVARWDGHRWEPLGEGVGPFPFGITATDGHLWLTGDFITAGGIPSYFLAHWEEETVIDAAEDQIPVAKASRIVSVYPNPFVSEATVRFNLPGPSAVRLMLYDELGRTVSTLADARFPSGTHEVRIPATLLAAGLYVCRLITGESQSSTTVIRIE